MYKNILFQSSAELLSKSLSTHTLPYSMLFSGDRDTGKFSCALETARVLSCSSTPQGEDGCSCPECSRYRFLTMSNLLVLGYRDCMKEIRAQKAFFLESLNKDDRTLKTSRLFFIRAIRKLLIRFSEVLMEGDDKMEKASHVLASINETLEEIDFPHELPDESSCVKCAEHLVTLCQSLQSEYLSSTIPINHIRSVSNWARLKTTDKAKIIIIENAQSMNDASRNALLKILEEPPKDTYFILTTSAKNQILSTILSRVRLYNFLPRSLEEDREILKVFFHKEYEGSVSDFLNSFLSIKSEVLALEARSYMEGIVKGKCPELSSLIKDLEGLKDPLVLKRFLQEMRNTLRPLFGSSCGQKALMSFSEACTKCFLNVTTYNISPQSALEVLFREGVKINVQNGNVFQCVNM